MDISSRKRTGIVTLSQHSSMSMKVIPTAVGDGKSSVSRIINQQKNFRAVSPKRKTSPDHLLDCWGIFPGQLFEDQDVVCDIITRKSQMGLGFSQMSEASAVQIPLYNIPALWFTMSESTFALATPKPITESVTKYNYIVANLPLDTASLVRYILMHPDATDPYAQIKNKLINRSGESSQKGAWKFLSGEELDSRKPSELLRNMKRHAESLNVDDKLMMVLFLQSLQSLVQTILDAVSYLTLSKAADIADRIFEVTPSPIETFAVSNKKKQTLESKLFREIEKLNERIDRLLISRGRSTVGTKIPVKGGFRISVIFQFAGFTKKFRKKW
ncbi:transposon Ty3-G Gag-Pol polyprotein [Trichonephila clavipes]|nr:transposon Ty3-G Gag-Pol polyprotein [Trichonephila clavipes]